MADRFIKNGARKLYNKLIHERPQDVLDKKVVGMAPGKVDVEDKSQRVRDNDLVLVQLGHVDIKSLAWVGFRRVESDALDSARSLHGFQCLFIVRWEQVV